MTHGLSRTIFQMPQEDHCRVNVVHAFHKPNLTEFVWTAAVMCGLARGDGIICKYNCFILEGSGCRISRSLT